MLAFALAAVIAIAVSLVVRSPLLTAAALLLAASYGMMLAWLRRIARHLRVERSCGDRAFTGDHLPVELIVQNTGTLPVPWIELEEKLPAGLNAARPAVRALRLGSRTYFRLDYGLHCARRGYYELGPVHIRTGDILGLQERLLILGEPQSLLVYPRVLPLHRLGLPTRSAVVSLPTRSPLLEDSTRLVGVRQYEMRDRMRSIHWPATARTGTLLVKKYQPATGRDTLICLDLAWSGYDLRQRSDSIELAFTIAASLAHHIIVREGLTVGLAAEGYDTKEKAWSQVSLAPAPDRAHLLRILEALARLKAGPEGDLPALLRRERSHLAWGSTIVVVAGLLRRDVALALVRAKRAGHAVVAVLAVPSGLPGNNPESCAAHGIPVHRVCLDRPLVEVG